MSVASPCAEHVVELAEDTDLFAFLEAALGDHGVSGMMVEFLSGEFGHIDFVHPAYGPDADHPMSFTAAFEADGPSVVRHAAATIGFRDGSPFGHIHASWTEPDGRIRGGHLLPGTQVGPAGLRLRLFALPEACLVSEVDPETGFSAFAPLPLQSGSASEAAPRPTSDTADVSAVVSRIRPGELLDEAVLAVCRGAGFDSAEVLASLGSTTGAVFTDGTAGWPAVEFTDLAGTVTGALGSRSRVHLTGEVVDVVGEVSQGVLVPGANPVAVTFELFVRRSA